MVIKLMSLKLNTMAEFHFGKNLRLLRLSKDITQEVVSLKLDISQTAYSRIERNAQAPKLELVLKIAEVLNVPPADLSSDLVDEKLPAVAAGTQEKPNETKAFFRLSLPLIVLVLIVALAVLPEWAYICVEGYCRGFGISERVMNIAQPIAGTLTVVGILYVGQRILRLVYERSKM